MAARQLSAVTVSTTLTRTLLLWKNVQGEERERDFQMPISKWSKKIQWKENHTKPYHQWQNKFHTRRQGPQKLEREQH